jgi:hypothetical protein
MGNGIGTGVGAVVTIFLPVGTGAGGAGGAGGVAVGADGGGAGGVCGLIAMHMRPSATAPSEATFRSMRRA